MKKNIILLILSILIFSVSSCDDRTIDVSVLPEATNTGEHTFGFMLDDWVYVGGRYLGRQSISFFYYADAKIKVHSALGTQGNNTICFDINNPVESGNCAITNVYFNNTEMPDGTAKISKFDTFFCIVSGTFSCGDRIQHGRFDVKFSQK